MGNQFDTTSDALAVSVQAADGVSTGGIVLGTASVAAGVNTGYTFRFTAPGNIDGGQFAARIPTGWPAPVIGGDSTNVAVALSAGSKGTLALVGREVRVP